VHRDELDRVAQALLRRETLDESEFQALLEGREPVAPVEPARGNAKTSRVPK
jgi:ATP-dependent Zn protease